MPIIESELQDFANFYLQKSGVCKWVLKLQEQGGRNVILNVAGRVPVGDTSGFREVRELTWIPG